MLEIQSLTAVFVAAATPTALLTVVIFLGRKWIGERIAQGIKHSYDARIEEIKSDLAQRSAMLSMAHRPLGENATTLLRHRIEAFQELWGGFMLVREACPYTIHVLDVLLEREFGQRLAQRNFKTAPPDITDMDFQAMMINNGPSGKPLVNTRLFAGEYAWSLFHVYRAINGRIAHLYREGRKAGSVDPWYRDEYARSLVQSVLNSEEFAEFDRQKFGRIGWVQLAVERKFLALADKILSGESTSEEMLRTAARITKAVQAEPK